jgi:hypothetical protein
LAPVSQSSWNTFASPSWEPSSSGTANSGSGSPRSASLVPRMPSSRVRSVFAVAITIRTRKAIPTKIE